MSRYVTVRLTVAQAEALDSAAAEVQSGEGEHWTTARWAVLGRARDVLVDALRVADTRKPKGA